MIINLIDNLLNILIIDANYIYHLKIIRLSENNYFSI